MGISEWAETARIIADDSLGILPDDRILIIAGDGIEKAEGINDLYEAVKEEMYSRGLLPAIISYRADVGVEPPEFIVEACSNADVMIFIYVRGLLHSSAYPLIQKNMKPGARLLMLPNGNRADYLNRMMPKTKEEFHEVADITEKVGGKFMGGKHKVRMTSENGTDLTFTIGGLSGWNHTGIAKDTGSALIPAGTLNVGVDEGSAEGILVIDTFTALKSEPLSNSIVFEIHDGYAASVTGGSEADDFIAASEKFEGTPEEKFCIAEFGLGFVRGADYHVNLSEGENMYGAAHIGIGSNVTFGGSVMIPAWHSDSLVVNATIELDGVVIAKDGEYFV